MGGGGGGHLEAELPRFRAEEIALLRIRFDRGAGRIGADEQIAAGELVQRGLPQRLPFLPCFHAVHSTKTGSRRNRPARERVVDTERRAEGLRFGEAVW